MSASVETVRTRSGKLRVSLAVLFVFFTLCAVACAVYLRAHTHITSSTVMVNAAPLADQDLLKQSLGTSTVAELFRSEYVLQAALRDLRHLPLLADVGEPVAWLKDHLKVHLHDGGNLVTVYMHGTETTAAEVATIVDTVVRAGIEEISRTASTAFFSQLEVLNARLQELTKQIRNLETDLASQQPPDPMLELRLEALRQSYIALSVRRQELELARSMTSSNVSVLTYAQTRRRGLSVARDIDSWLPPQ